MIQQSIGILFLGILQVSLLAQSPASGIAEINAAIAKAAREKPALKIVFKDTCTTDLVVQAQELIKINEQESERSLLSSRL